MKIVEWAKKLAPVEVFGLICSITIRVGFGAIVGMAAYMGTVPAELLRSCSTCSLWERWAACRP